MRQIHKLQPNLHVLEVTRPEFTVRSVAVVGERHAVVWDTLTGAEDMTAFEPAIGAKPFHVVYSHADWDHIWGTNGFSRPPLDIIGHRACLRRFDEEAAKTLYDMQLAEPGNWDDIELIPPNLVFGSRMSLDLGGITLDMHHLPGHSRDCIVGWIPEWGVLLGGDAIETPLPIVHDPGSLATWLDSLETWANMGDLKRAIAAHGSIKGRESLDSTVDYLRRLIAGDDIEFASELDDFYRGAHEKNLELARGVDQGND
ncbi:MAG: MBL fold metallo-hydrolase [Chloroflexi bacterium]|nr:MBL fold metallo-hydrolase [Chloroflexota bacterium]